MICGFDISPRANIAITIRKRQPRRSRSPGFGGGAVAYLRYASSASRKNNMLSRFLRSAIHATDSTLMGCSANSAATIQLRPAKPVARNNTQNSSSAFRICSATLTSCGPAGVTPNNCTSSACDSQVTGCQFAASRAVSAQRIVVQVEAGPDVNVVADVVGIVVVGEGLPVDRVVNRQDGDGEQTSEKKVLDRGVPSSQSGRVTLLDGIDINGGHAFAPESRRFERACLQACRKRAEGKVSTLVCHESGHGLGYWLGSST